MKLAEKTSPQIARLSRDTTVLIPLGALEQHSAHLPLFVDSMVVGELARRAEEQFAEQVLLTPVMWLGNSEHHLDFPGTMTASPRVYLDLVVDMVHNFLHAGFKRIVLLNGHGGNTVPGQQALYEVRQRHRERKDLLLLMATYWTLGGDARESVKGLRQPQVQHACQWETSMMLHLRPDLVGDFKSLPTVDYGDPFLPAMRSWVTQDVSALGHIGEPQYGDAEIGRQLLDFYTAGVVALLRRVVAWDGKSWSA